MDSAKLKPNASFFVIEGKANISLANKYAFKLSSDNFEKRYMKEINDHDRNSDNKKSIQKKIKLTTKLPQREN